MIFFNLLKKLLLILVPLFSFITYAIAQKCEHHQCDPSTEAIGIRFPFREVDHQPKPCGYPGFDVRCKGTNVTIEFPNLVTLGIDSIYYEEQIVYLWDPDGCLPSKLFSLNLSTSHFYALDYQVFTVFNCSGYFVDSEYNNTTSNELHKVECLSGYSFTVYAVQSLWAVSLLSSTCQLVVANVSVPGYSDGSKFYDFFNDETEISLYWDEPKCGLCEKLHRHCGVNNSTHRIECTTSQIPNSGGNLKSLVLSLVIGLPVILVALFVSMAWIQRRMQRNNVSATGNTWRMRNHTTIGISQSTLDSYPTVAISESGQLPTADNNNCPICLSKYKINDVLKILPHCLHHFHVACIDQWLLLDVTCPICRVAPL